MNKKPEWEAAGFATPDEFRRGEDAFWTVLVLVGICVIVTLAIALLWGLQKWGG